MHVEQSNFFANMEQSFFVSCLILSWLFQVSAGLSLVWISAILFSVAPLLGWNRFVSEVGEIDPLIVGLLQALVVKKDYIRNVTYN